MILFKYHNGEGVTNRRNAEEENELVKIQDQLIGTEAKDELL